MIAVIKIISAKIESGISVIQFLFLGKITKGKGDVRTAKQISPFGIDSAPTNDKRGLYVSTTTIGKYYSVGVINTNCKAQPGETRIFSTDNSGQFKYNIWLKGDGTVLMGDSDNPASYTNFAVKYNESKAENDKLKATVDDLVQRWNTFCGSYSPGSPSTVGTPPTLATSTVAPNSSNFTLIKNEKIKTN